MTNMTLACARQAGVATQSRVELFVQNSYFVFQVLQVFLVTTLTSTIASSLNDLIKNPMGIRKLLSTALPKASNFYISYFILQGLAMSASRIVHLGGLIRHQLMRWAGGRPRIMARRYHRLRKIHWGSVFPMFTNMGVIGSSIFASFSVPPFVFRHSILTCIPLIDLLSNNILPHRPPNPRRRHPLPLPRLLDLQIQPPLRLLVVPRL